MTVFLETKRLFINIPEAADFENLYALQNDPEVMKYIGKGVRTKEEVTLGLEKAIAHQAKHGFSAGSVYEKSSGHFVGRAGLFYLAFDDTQPNIEVAYGLMRNAWNKGYATELVKAILHWGFDHLQVNKLVAVIKPENERSRRVLEKVKMSYVGRVKYGDIEAALYEIPKPNIDFQKIKLIPASLKDYPIIQNMARFYVYDMSEYMGKETGWELPEDGLYECIDFKKYWETENNFPFLIRYADELVGFAIVDKKGSDTTIDFNMAQFFILRKFHGKGIGRYVAEQCFKKFRGNWEIMVMPGNEGAYRFWRATIKDFCASNFIEYTRAIAHFEGHSKNIFKFNSK